MNRKISLGLAVALIFVSITATFAITMTVSQKIYNGLISRLSNRFELYDGFSEIDNYVRTNYCGDFDDDSLLAYSAEGYMQGLNDPGSFYMTAQQYIEYTRRMAGEGGIGISAAFDSASGKVSITQIYAGSSAENAEMKVGDVIVSVNDTKVTEDNAPQMIEALQVGRRFESVSVTYERGGVEKTVTVMRGYTKTVMSSSLGDTGYVRFTGFYANTAEQFSAELDTLNEQGITALIIDLRGCSEGSVDYASAVADLLLPSGAETTGAIASAIDKDGGVYKNFTSDTSAITFPGGIVVLTDGKTSGGAELVAAQLHDFSKCSIIGTKTAGQMTLQQIYALDDGSAISLTVAEVSSYGGHFYREGEGIAPDTEIVLDKQAAPAVSLDDIGSDAVLTAALGLLSQ